MFYEKEDIENELLKCPSCSLIYDVPNILPCGEMVCNRCLNKLTEKGHAKRISCQFCKGIHVVPYDGFLIQKRLFNLLNKKPKKVFRGVEFERTEILLDDIKSIINNFYQSIGEIKANFKKYCDDLRDSIECDNKVAIEEHEINKQKLFSEIDIYERKCFEKMQYESNLQKSYSTFLKESTEKINKWNEILNRADLNKNDIDLILNEALNLREAMASELDMLKKLMCEKLLKYCKHNKNSKSTHFGSLYYDDEQITISRATELETEEATKKEKKFIPLKDFLAIFLSPISHISFTLINLISSEIENLNNKFQEGLLKAYMSLYIKT